MKTSKNSEIKSEPNGPENNLPASLSRPISERASIDSLVAFLAAGVGGFIEAGKQLVELYDQDSGVFAKIIHHAPWVTVDMLHTLLRIGRKELHPTVLLYSGRRIFDRLAALPYDRQEKVVNNPVEMSKLMQKSTKEIRSENRRVAADWHAKASGPAKLHGDHLLNAKTIERMGINVPAIGVKKGEEVPIHHQKDHGMYMVVIKPGKNPQFFKRCGAPMDAQRVRLMKDPDDPGALIANLDLYEVI